MSGFGTLDYAHTKQNVQVSVKVVSPQTAGAWYLHGRRSAASGVRVKIRAVGQCQLMVKTVAGELSYGTDQPVTAGMVIAVRSRGTTHELLINGVVKTTAVVSGVTGSTSSRFEAEGDLPGLALDELKMFEVLAV